MIAFDHSSYEFSVKAKNIDTAWQNVVNHIISITAMLSMQTLSLINIT